MEDRLTARSEEVQEILGTPPSWMVQWGTTLVIASVIALGLVSWYFRYPERVVANMVLTTSQPPVPVFAQSDGYLAMVWAEDGDSVSANQPLALLSNPAKYEDVQKLEAAVEELQSFDQDAFLSYQPDRGLELGALQAPYLSFLQVFEDFSFTKNTDYDRKSTRKVKSQIKRIEETIWALNRQKATSREDLIIAQQQFAVQHNKYDGDLGDLEKLQEARANQVAKEKEIAQIDGEIAEKRTRISELNAQILAIQQGESTNNLSQYQELQSALADIQTALRNWKQKYLLKAPVDGQVTFYNLPKEQKYVLKGDKVMAILPPQESQELIGEARLPVEGSGKVQAGQRVIIKFDSYPFQEFGYVEGVVQTKALLAQDNTYSVSIGLTEGLVTNSGRELTFRQQMTAKAELITDNKRFALRILEQLSSLFANY